MPTPFHLNAENAHVEHAMADTESLQEDLFKEFLSRIEEDDQGVPTARRFTITTEPKKEKLPIFCRKSLEENAEEEILLDVNNSRRA